MSLVDFTRKLGRRAVEPVTEKITETAAAVVDLFKERNWKMSVAQIDEKLVVARAAVSAAETAHAAAAAEYAIGENDDDRAVSRARKALVAAREKVEDLAAARAAALMNAEDADHDAAAKAEAARIESIESAVDELVPLAQKVEECLDALAVALSDLWAGVNALALADRRPAHAAVLDAMNHLPTLAYFKLGKLGLIPQGANYMTLPGEMGLVRRLPDPTAMAAMCPPKQPAAPGKKKHAGSYFVPA